MEKILLEVGLVYFLGYFLGFIFRKYKIPDVLIFMILGLFLGPVFQIARIEEFGNVGSVLSSMALMVIMFQSGVSLNLNSLAKISFKGTVLTLVTFFISCLVIMLLSYPFTGSWVLSLVTAFILSGTSSAVVIPMAKALNLSEDSQNILLLESTITDVLCIILTISVSMSLVSGAIDIGQIFNTIGMSFFIALVLGGVAGIIWSHYKDYFAALSTIAFALVIYGFVALQGFSGAIAVMAMGFALTNARKVIPKIKSSGLTEAETAFYSEISFILKTFFFIYLGISLKLNSVWMILISVLITLFILGFRHFFNKIFFKQDLDGQERDYLTLMIPKGLAAAVLADIPVKAGLVGAEVIPGLVYSVVFISILIVSILIPMVGRR